MIKTYRSSNKACHIHILMSLLCLFLISFLSACDNSAGNNQDATGTASFQIQWPEDETIGVAASQWLVSADGYGSSKTGITAAAVTVSEDCSSRGIDKVSVEVRDAAENLLVSKEFSCNAGVGKISVPVGSGRIFLISGLGGDGAVRYYGGKDDVTIRAGSNDIGVIQMERSAEFFTDNDGDGFYKENDCGTAIDCNDNDKNSYPGAIEICGDGIDQDCDGSDAECTTDPDAGRYYGDFAITALKYDDDSDWDQKILEIFGSGYRVADWNDLKAYYNNGGNLLSLYDGLGLTDYGASAYVTRNGDPSYSSTRYYFASRHEGTRPSSYLAHDNLGGYIISLGSWDGTNKIMAIKRSPNVPDTLTNTLGMDFVYIEPGTFMMGSPTDEPGRKSDENLHQVTLTKGFYMQATEVTQGQWTAVMGSNPSYFSSCGDNCPVEEVSWNDAQDFITTLNARGEGTYRLPTEAEWEYAARSGSTTAFANGGITVTNCEYDPNLDAMGWYCGNAGGASHPVAQKQANAWGLYDMHGNVYEWCQDWYGSYPSGSLTDPEGPLSGTGRVFRGGSWYDKAKYCRSDDRIYDYPENTYQNVGFRLVSPQVGGNNDVDDNPPIIGNETLSSSSGFNGENGTLGSSNPLKIEMSWPIGDVMNGFGYYDYHDSDYEGASGRLTVNLYSPTDGRLILTEGSCAKFDGIVLNGIYSGTHSNPCFPIYDDNFSLPIQLK